MSETCWDSAIQIVKDAKDGHLRVLDAISSIDKENKERFIHYADEDDHIILDLETAKRNAVAGIYTEESFG